MPDRLTFSCMSLFPSSNHRKLHTYHHSPIHRSRSAGLKDDPALPLSHTCRGRGRAAFLLNMFMNVLCCILSRVHQWATPLRQGLKLLCGLHVSPMYKWQRWNYLRWLIHELSMNRFIQMCLGQREFDFFPSVIQVAHVFTKQQHGSSIVQTKTMNFNNPINRDWVHQFRSCLSQ